MFSVSLILHSLQSTCMCKIHHLILSTILVVGKQEWIAPFYRWENKDFVKLSNLRFVPRVAEPAPQCHNFKVQILFFSEVIKGWALFVSSASLERYKDLILLPLVWSQIPPDFAVGRSLFFFFFYIQQGALTADLRAESIKVVLESKKWSGAHFAD